MPVVSAGPDDPFRFSCRVCSKCFTLKSSLNKHIWSHSDVKRHVCSFCGKGFNDTSDLKKHIWTHTETGDMMPASSLFIVNTGQAIITQPTSTTRH
uniref:C2H2-type domain-containing protein n=1 Tax=Timema poppense TaxID=170557 RepID=A0A7R9DM19_TIMPO|nr:unnamed protein product [Timema poppensis]